MPSKETHLEQYQHNRDFLEHGISDTNKFADWAVTVTFYCAVHIVEAALANIFHLGHTMVFPIKVMFNSVPPFQANFTIIRERGQLDNHLLITSGKEKFIY